VSLAVVDHEGDLFAYIEEGPANRALARGEIVRHPEHDRVFVLRPDAVERFKVTGSLSPEAKRRRFLKVNGGR
jgi:hypothetical protein